MNDFDSVNESLVKTVAAFRTAGELSAGAADRLDRLRQMVINEKVELDRERAQWSAEREQLLRTQREIATERNDARSRLAESTTKNLELEGKIDRLETENRTITKRAELTATQLQSSQQKNNDLSGTLRIVETENHKFSSKIDALERKSRELELDYKRALEIQAEKFEIEKAEILAEKTNEFKTTIQAFENAMREAREQVKELSVYKIKCKQLTATVQMYASQVRDVHKLQKLLDRYQKNESVVNRPDQFLRAVGGSSVGTDSSESPNPELRRRSRSILAARNR